MVIGSQNFHLLVRRDFRNASDVALAQCMDECFARVVDCAVSCCHSRVNFVLGSTRHLRRCALDRLNELALQVHCDRIQYIVLHEADDVQHLTADMLLCALELRNRGHLRECILIQLPHLDSVVS